jgi:hypothetical protein
LLTTHIFITAGPVEGPMASGRKRIMKTTSKLHEQAAKNGYKIAAHHEAD